MKYFLSNLYYILIIICVLGRCARAGRDGTAFSLVTPDEYAYLVDLYLFLGRPLDIATEKNKQGSIGKIPQSLIEEQHSSLVTLHDNQIDLVGFL